MDNDLDSTSPEPPLFLPPLFCPFHPSNFASTGFANTLKEKTLRRGRKNRPLSPGPGAHAATSTRKRTRSTEAKRLSYCSREEYQDCFTGCRERWPQKDGSPILSIELRARILAAGEIFAVTEIMSHHGLKRWLFALRPQPQNPLTPLR